MRTILTGMLLTAGLLISAANPTLAQLPTSPYVARWPAAFPAVPNTANNPLTTAEVGKLLTDMNYAPYKMPDLNSSYFVKIKRDGFGITVQFVLGRDGSQLYIKTVLAKVDASNAGQSLPWQKMIAIQEKINPVMFCYSEDTKQLIIRYPVANRQLNRETLASHISCFLDTLMSTRSLWDLSQQGGNGLTNPPSAPAPYFSNVGGQQRQAQDVLSGIQTHRLQIGKALVEFSNDIDAFLTGKSYSIAQLRSHRQQARAATVELLTSVERMPVPADADGRQYVLAYKSYARWALAAFDELFDHCLENIGFAAANGSDATILPAAQAIIEANAIRFAQMLQEQTQNLDAAQKKFVQHYHLVAAN